MKNTRKSWIVASSVFACLAAGAAFAAQEIKLARYENVEVCFNNRFTENGGEKVRLEGREIEVDAIAGSGRLEQMHSSIDGNRGCVKASVTGYVSIEKGKEVFKLLDATQE